MSKTCSIVVLSFFDSYDNIFKAHTFKKNVPNFCQLDLLIQVTKFKKYKSWNPKVELCIVHNCF